MDYEPSAFCRAAMDRTVSVAQSSAHSTSTQHGVRLYCHGATYNGGLSVLTDQYTEFVFEQGLQRQVYAIVLEEHAAILGSGDGCYGGRCAKVYSLLSEHFLWLAGRVGESVYGITHMPQEIEQPLRAFCRHTSEWLLTMQLCGYSEEVAAQVPVAPVNLVIAGVNRGNYM